MKMDIKQDIILPAWEIMKNDNKVKKLQFLPWLLSMIFLSTLLVYQSMYTYLVMTDKKEEVLESLMQFIHSTYMIEFLVSTMVFLLLYLFIVPVFEWALVKYMSKKDLSGNAEISESMSFWLYKFLPVFKYNNLFSEFKFMSVVNWYLFILSFFEFKYMSQMNYIFLAMFMFSVIMNMFFSYSKYMMMIENLWLFKSIWKSVKISLMNMKNTAKLYFLMFILNMSVIFNFMVFLIFPVLMMVIMWFVTSQMLKTLVLMIMTMMFMLFMLFLGYLTWVLEALKMAIWYYAYKKWKQSLESIEEEIK